MDDAGKKQEKILILGEPLVQYTQRDGEETKVFSGLAGDSYNFALTLSALQKKYGGDAKLYFGTAFSSCADEPKPDGINTISKMFKGSLEEAGIDAHTFIKDTADHHTGTYTLHLNADGSSKDGDAVRHSFDRDQAAARYYFTPDNVKEFERKIKKEGITKILGSHIMLGNSEDRAAKMQLLDAVKRLKEAGQDIEIIWADNHRASVWENAPHEATQYSNEAMRRADVAFVSFDDEKKMHGDESPEKTADRIHNAGVKEVFITNGGNPILVSRVQEGNIIQKEVEPAPLKKGAQKFPAGAGDCFAAGCAYSRLRWPKKTMAEHAELGSKVASEVMALKKDNLGVDDLPPAEELFKTGDKHAKLALLPVRPARRDPLKPDGTAPGVAAAGNE